MTTGEADLEETWRRDPKRRLGHDVPTGIEETHPLARRIVEAVISGRVEERFGRSRSIVTVTFANGSTEFEVGTAGIKGMLPQRG